MGTSYSVLLAGCVDPSVGPFRPWRRDPTVRLADYERGLAFWLGLSDRRVDSIVFAENSGHALDTLQRLAERHGGPRPVEFVACPPESPPPGAHYGHSELAMVDRCVLESRLLSLSPRFIKANGESDHVS